MPNAPFVCVLNTGTGGQVWSDVAGKVEAAWL